MLDTSQRRCTALLLRSAAGCCQQPPAFRRQPLALQVAVYGCCWNAGPRSQHSRCGPSAPERWSSHHVPSSSLSWYKRLCRSILFALSFFHATLLERKKFGVGNQPGARSGIGWNMGYPFNLGDLLCCGQLAANYLDNSSRVSGWLCHASPTVRLPGCTPNLQAVHVPASQQTCSPRPSVHASPATLQSCRCLGRTFGT